MGKDASSAVTSFLESIEPELDSLLTLSTEERSVLINEKWLDALTKTGTAAEGLPAPGAVRVYFDDRDESDSESLLIGGSTIQSPTETLAVAAEVAPNVTEMEAELEEYRQRFDSEVVHADVAVAQVPPTQSRCCIIL